MFQIPVTVIPAPIAPPAPLPPEAVRLVRLAALLTRVATGALLLVNTVHLVLVVESASRWGSDPSGWVHVVAGQALLVTTVAVSVRRALTRQITLPITSGTCDTLTYPSRLPRCVRTCADGPAERSGRHREDGDLDADDDDGGGLAARDRSAGAGAREPRGVGGARRGCGGAR